MEQFDAGRQTAVEWEEVEALLGAAHEVQLDASAAN